MNWAELQRDWKRGSSLIKSYWEKLTDNDLEWIDGCRERLAVCLRRHYDYGAEQAEGAICAFEEDVRYPGAVK